MARKPKGSYSQEIIRIINTPPEKVASMSMRQQRKYQETLTWYREQERIAAENEKLSKSQKPKAERAAATPRTILGKNPPADARPPVSVSKQVASFLWGWDIKATLSRFASSLAMLVQIFAQVLINVGLLPPDHPARTFRGAVSYKIFQLLEEAKSNLLPIRLIWEGFQEGGTAPTRIFAMRQYVIFSSIIGVLVTGSLAVIMLLAKTVFGTAHAFAQTGAVPAMTAGSFTATGDLAGNFMDAVFGGTNSVISAGLGTMFSLYSNIMLIFAGIIVLWIIISSVAETARTGIPFGKQFNTIWAPIRLVVALGLLVPLGSGLNSGQYMVISLARWGSTQASTLWGSFASNMMINTSTTATGGSATTVNGALNAVPLSLSSTRSVADQAFDMMLCETLQNAYYTKFASIPNASNMMISHSNPILSQTPAGESTVNTGGAVAQPVPAENVYTISFGRAKDDNGNPRLDSSGNQITDGSCGSLSIKLPSTFAGVPNALSAADIAKSQILSAQSTDLKNLVAQGSPGYQLANQVAQSAIDYVTGPGTNGPAYDWNSWGATTQQAIASKYKAYVDGYTAARTQSVANELTSYGTGLANNLGGGSCGGAGTIGCNLQSDTKIYGWASAPMWINAISDQNGKVMSVLDSSTPTISPSADGPSATGDGQLMDAWRVATQVQTLATNNIGVGLTPTTKRTAEMMYNALHQLTQPSANPLGDLPAYGREFMATGVRLITPPNVATCLDDPSQVGCDWVLKDAATMAAKSGSAAGVLTQSQIAKLQTKSGDDLKTSYRADIYNGDSNGTFLPSGTKLDLINQLIKAGGNDAIRPYMGPIGLVLISFGFTLGYILALIPYARFMLGILNWMMQLFESLLGMPLLSLALLKTDGEGFAPQQVMSCFGMLLGLVLRPSLMIFGLVLGLMAFNGIYQIVALTFLPTVLNLSGFNGDSDDSVISAAGYIIFYGTFVYTLANSAFKMIDLLPNYVMGWIGQRGESRTDDASVVQQTAGQYSQTLAYSMRTGGGHIKPAGDLLHDKGASAYDRQQAGLGNASWESNAKSPGGGAWVNPPSNGASNSSNIGGQTPGSSAPSSTPQSAPASTPSTPAADSPSGGGAKFH
jgi:conjugal transfer/type IV secretion protein DotA/TraY